MINRDLHVEFKQLDAEDDFVGLPQTVLALDSILETIPRELVQNTYDAREEGKKPQINFFFECLEGPKLDDFKQAIDWGTLRPHLEAVAEHDEKLGVQKALDQIDRGELYVLGVEDVNALGLDGDDDSRGTNYARLVKDFADSSKEEGGGIHGVGASVLWAFSGFQLVLFNSSAKGENYSKLVGRLDLPDHELNGQEYKGGGWLGVDDQKHHRPVAMLNPDDSFAKTLRIDRPNEHGTTALVVGFQEPTRRTRPIGEIVDGIYEAAAQYYWPLIDDGGIKVTVQGPSDRSPRTVKPKTVDRAAPYIDAYESWENPDEDFGEPGTVAVKEVEFEVPPIGSRPATTGELVLVVRIVGKTDLEKYRNKVAMFRGARHVVKYRDYGSVSRTTGRDFHALLLAGGAKHDVGLPADSLPDAGDKAIESFFRDAEPEAHNTWEKPTHRQTNYDDDNPSQRIVSFLKSDVKLALQQLLGAAQTDDDDRVDTLGSEFPFFRDEHGSGNGGNGGGGGGTSEFHVPRIESWFDGAHQYRGEFKLDSQPEGDWTVVVSIDEVDGSNRTIDQIDVADGGTPHGTKRLRSDGKIEFTFDKGTLNPEFQLTSEHVGDEILAGRTRLDFEYDISGGSSP